jgi:arylsulfatase A-like enzyme
VSAQVRTIDLLPTLLELAGIEPDPSIDGRSLLPFMRGEEDADRMAFSERMHKSKLQQAAVRFPDYKLIVNYQGDPGQATVELYDLRQDPDELRNLAEERSEQRSQLRALLHEQRSAIAGRRDFDPAGEITDELKHRLESLGYVD